MENVDSRIVYKRNPLNGEFTGCYLSNKDGSARVAHVTVNPEPSIMKEVKDSMDEYKWHDEDYLLASYPKNGKGDNL